MKEVRFNDKLWFGLHRGERISDLIKNNPAYIQRLVRENKIKLDEKSNTFFENKFEDKKGYGFGYNDGDGQEHVYGRPRNIGMNEYGRRAAPRGEPALRGEPEQIIAPGVIQVATRIRMVTIDISKAIISKLVNEAFKRENNDISDGTLAAISTIYIEKIQNNPINWNRNGGYEFKIIRIPNIHNYDSELFITNTDTGDRTAHLIVP